MTCQICGQDCGPLQGKTKSWSCAGVLSTRTKRERTFGKRDAMRRLFGSSGKQRSRELLRDDLLALPEKARVLDLYGGGLSAEWILSVRPDLQLVCAEKDRSLWSALKHDAARVGYQPLLGHFEIALGAFDLIWLDLCGEPLLAWDALRRVRPMVHKASGIYVTVMRQNRHGYDELRGEAFDIAVAAILESALSGLPYHAGDGSAERIHSYRQAGGRGIAELWRVGPSHASKAMDIRYHETRIAEGAAIHRQAVSRYHGKLFAEWKGEADVFISSLDEGPCARGNCRCADKGYITIGEWLNDRERWVAAARPGDVGFGDLGAASPA